MTLFHGLPTDSVLYRHALTERMRQLGLPPTDSVLRRHHAQWLSMLAGHAGPSNPVAQPGLAAVAAAAPKAAAVAAAVAAPVAAAAATAARVVSTAAPQVAPPVAATPAAAPAPGGFFGWLKRLFG